MNLDGTYPDTESTAHQKLIESKQSSIRPPVRVVVSYPASEEWDGRNRPSCCKYLTYGITICSIVLALLGCFVYYNFYRLNTPTVIDIDNTVDDIDIDSPVDILTIEEPIGKIDYQQKVEQFYEFKRKTMDLHGQLNFFTKEQIRFEENKLDQFLLELDGAIPIYLPKDSDIYRDINDAILSYIHRKKAWIKTLVDQEERFQNNYNKTRSSLEKPSNRTKSEIQEWKELVDKYTKPMEITVDDDFIQFYGTVVLFNDVVNRLQLFPNVTKVSIIASIIYLDRNFTSNKDLAIFAPTWKFITPLSLDLRGKNASDPYENVPDGRNGYPGEDAGFFLAAGNVDISQILIFNDGGRGTRGHAGPDGKNGSSANATTDQSTCIMLNPQFTFNNSAGEQVKLFYVFADELCGTVGGPGGAAGAFGKGGQALFFLPTDFKSLPGKNGERVSDGTPGIDGVSATSNCTFARYKMWSEETKSWNWSTPIISKDCLGSNETFWPPLIKNPNVKKYSNNVLKTPKNLTIFEKFIANFSLIARTAFDRNGDNSLFSLLKQMENKTIISNLTSPLSLFEEYNTMDDKFTKVDIFESFLNKIRYLLNATNENEAKIALEYLQVAVWCKISYLRRGFDEFYIIDIEQYLDSILDTLKTVDVNVLTINTVNDGKKELIKKLEEIKNASNYFTTILNEKDRRMFTLTSTIAKSMSIIINLTLKYLQDESGIKYQHDLKKLVQEYKKEKLIQYKLFFNISSDSEHGIYNKAKEIYGADAKRMLACAEMMLTIAEECQKVEIDVGRSLKYKKMDENVMTAFSTFTRKQGFSAVNDLLQAILQNVKPYYSKTSAGRYHVRNLMSLVHDLLTVVKQSWGQHQDEQLRNGMAKLARTPVQDKALANAVQTTKSRILTSLLKDQYKRALYAYQQWAYPYTENIAKAPNTADKKELISAIKEIKNELKIYHSTIQKRDRYLIKGEFGKNPIDPFYTWTNEANRQEIEMLLRGKKTQFRAIYAESPHAPFKQAIKFKEFNLKFSAIPPNILKKFSIKMTHSGFSEFFYNDTSYTAVGPQLHFEFNFDLSILNEVYNKVKNGNTILSPYTTWTIQLINNKGSFKELLQYANSTSVHLVGLGSYYKLPNPF